MTNDIAVTVEAGTMSVETEIVRPKCPRSQIERLAETRRSASDVESVDIAERPDHWILYITYRD